MIFWGPCRPLQVPYSACASLGLLTAHALTDTSAPPVEAPPPVPPFAVSAPPAVPVLPIPEPSSAGRGGPFHVVYVRLAHPLQLLLTLVALLQSWRPSTRTCTLSDLHMQLIGLLQRNEPSASFHRVWCREKCLVATAG